MVQGQLSIWEIESIKKPSSYMKTEEKVREMEVPFTKSLTEITTEESEKPSKLLELTEKQQRLLDKKSILGNENLFRVIKYCGGGLGIELINEDSYKTIYVNTEGEEEFNYNKRLSVLPMDTILYFKDELTINQLQEERLKEFKDNTIKIIKRKGDENIIVELQDKIASINPIGWVLEFNNCKAIYEESEIVKAEEKPTNREVIGDDVKVGDIVEAYYGKEIIQGEIVREYGVGNQILNIIFDSGKKHTAIGRLAVINKNS